MNHRTYATLAPAAPCNGENASSVHDFEYHLALALRCVQAFILEEYDTEDDHAALQAALEAIAEMQAQADLPGPEP